MQIKKIHPHAEVIRGTAVFMDIYIFTWNILYLHYLVDYWHSLDILLFIKCHFAAIKMVIISGASADIYFLFFHTGILVNSRYLLGELCLKSMLVVRIKGSQPPSSLFRILYRISPSFFSSLPWLPPQHIQNELSKSSSDFITYLPSLLSFPGLPLLLVITWEALMI